MIYLSALGAYWNEYGTCKALSKMCFSLKQWIHTFCLDVVQESNIKTLKWSLKSIRGQRGEKFTEQRESLGSLTLTLGDESMHDFLAWMKSIVADADTVVIDKILCAYVPSFHSPRLNSTALLKLGLNQFMFLSTDSIFLFLPTDPISDVEF